MPINCKGCKHFDDRDYEIEGCWLGRDFGLTEKDNCGYHEEEVELTDEEKDAIEGDIECHRRLVEGGEIE